MNIQKIILIILVFLIILILLLKKSKKIEQNKGEIEVNDYLNKLKKYKLLEDIMIKREKRTTQIDHILISRKGIFVIETKDFSGKIIGDEDSKFWIQKLNFKENHFYSPIKQNYGHVKAVEEIIGRKNICMSLIVFTNKSNIKKVKTETPVIQVKKLTKYIKKYKSDIRLSKEEVEEFYKILNKKDMNSRSAIKKHIKNIEKLKLENKC